MATQFSAEQFAAAQKAQIDGLLTLANTAFAGIERLAALNLNTARSLLEDSAGNARALLAAKDYPDFVALQGSLAQPAIDKAVAWSRDAYTIGSATGGELKKTLETRYAEASEALDSSLDALVKNAPAGSDAVLSASVDVIKSALGVANTAYATFSKAAQQAGEYAETHFAASATPAAPTPKGKKAQ